MYDLYGKFIETAFYEPRVGRSNRSGRIKQIKGLQFNRCRPFLYSGSYGFTANFLASTLGYGRQLII